MERSGRVGLFQLAWWVFRLWCMGRASIAAENLAPRQQLCVLKHSGGRPNLKPRDRLFWVVWRMWFAGWRNWLVIVQPETVCRWHRLGFR